MIGRASGVPDKQRAHGAPPVLGPAGPQEGAGSGIEQCPTPPARASKAAPARAAAVRNGIASGFIYAFEARDDAAFEASMVADTADHNPLPGQRPGWSGVLDTLAMYRAEFPDLTLTIERQVAEGDLVVQNGLAKRNNTGPLMGRPATGAPTQFAWIDMYRITDDRITESWHLKDVAGLLQQLAAAAAPAST